jgi:hypothetical protein
MNCSIILQHTFGNSMEICNFGSYIASNGICVTGSYNVNSICSNGNYIVDSCLPCDTSNVCRPKRKPKVCRVVICG